ncbi:MAG: T9SS type A sorting domain-containing protein [Chloroflexota bacterium]
MKTRIFPAVILSFLFLAVAEGQDFLKNSTVTGICYAGKNVHMLYIPPPDAFMKKGAQGGGNITVYYTGFPENAKAAFEYAISVLESVLPSGTFLTVNAKWEKITTENVLGNSTITGFAAGWGIDALDPLAYYPVGLAEKISGGKLNSDLQGDVEMRINSSINWYTGIDGQVPATKYDLVTVVLHEMCHGLGFFDSMNTQSTIGYYGLGALPMVFDKFVENLNGQRLTDTLIFENNSAELYTQFTGGQLYFDGPLTKSYTAGGRARLYSPAKWDNGSSVSHLDEESNKDNPLMTPYIDLGEAIHDPGKLTMSILGDVGWINTRIIHDPAGDTEEHITQMPLIIEVKSDTTYNRDKVGVVYSFDDFVKKDTLYMTSSNADNTFRANVSIPAYNSGLQYYFFVEDKFRRRFASPSFHDAIRYSAYIGTDTIDPVVQHTPVKYCLQTSDTVGFSAVAYDNLGVDSLFLEYRINKGPLRYKGFTAGKNDEFSSWLRLKDLNVSGGDSIYYRIFARDTAQISNTSILPGKSYFVFPVERIESVVESYSTDFTDATSDFFSLGFSITQPTGFNSPGLHTKHPYESPETDNGSINYTAILRHPVKFDDSGLLISFREVVLVEPGEAGSLFGTEDFYDYVVVEASKDAGQHWIALADGYDSRILKSWEDSYNQHLSGNNSTYNGAESMLQKHTVYYKPSDKIAAGDTLLIRFRLFSDPYANGWGWTIQDLSINALINSAGKDNVEPVVAYPNPGNGYIKFKGLQAGRPYVYSIYNSTGIILVNNKISDNSTIIDLSSFPAGMYIIVLKLDGETRTIRYSLIP